MSRARIRWTAVPLLISLFPLSDAATRMTGVRRDPAGLAGVRSVVGDCQRGRRMRDAATAGARGGGRIVTRSKPVRHMADAQMMNIAMMHNILEAEAEESSYG